MKRAAAEILIFPRRVHPFSQHKVPTREGGRAKERKREQEIYNLILQCSSVSAQSPYRCIIDLPQLISVIANLIHYHLMEQKTTEQIGNGALAIKRKKLPIFV